MSDAIEQAARVIAVSDFPDLWSDDPRVAHRAASPLAVSSAREVSMQTARHHAQALHEAGMLVSGEPVAWRVKFCSSQKWNLWDSDPCLEEDIAGGDRDMFEVQALVPLPTPPEGK